MARAACPFTSPPDRMSPSPIAEASLSAIHAASPVAPFVVAQLGQSLDGRIATVTGDSRAINNAYALEHLHAVRAAVDAVLVGVGTVIADDPRLTVRRVPGRHPARVVIDPHGRAPLNARCFAENGANRFCITARDRPLAEHVQPIVLPARHGEIAPADIVNALFGCGLRKLLVEGGAGTVSRFVAAGCVDRLHVLLSPIILGSGKAGLELAPIATTAEALRPRARVHVFPDGDVLFDCDLKAPGHATQASN
jgi:diaminohydroxyphosphoribosylaminopyrimidine deaminase/5-amino-6-(5-phosphoribosylamino)uracil reductase